MLGLKHGVNLLVDYDPEWPIAFEEERARIQSAVGDVLRGSEHYGSTAGVGLRAKPIIDILLGVTPLDNWIRCREPLEMLGYDYAEDAGVPGHHIFGRGRDRSERTHLAHLVEFNGPSWRSSLAFRDALRKDELLRTKYVEMKEKAATLAPIGRATYNELKHLFIERFVNQLRQSST
jgi:GrpB-like predicted nucleotidyltransferase (UPF0157 family)